MFVTFKSRFIFTVVFMFTVLILEGDSKRPSIKEGTMPLKRDYRPSKWVANSAMDVWYGNKSMIDIISREFSDVMFRLTARPVRSALEIPITNKEDKNITGQETAYRFSRVEVHFFDEDNETIHTVQLQPRKELTTTTISAE